MTSNTRAGDKGIELLTSGMASGGDAIAHDAAGKAVFVRGALPGERVRVRLVTDRARYAIGSIDELMESSPDRVMPPCPEVDRGCGACQWQYVSIAMQQRLKLQFIVESLERSGVRCPDPSPSVELAPWAFRTTIKAAITDGRAGYLRTRSHQVIPVDTCLVAHPLLVDLLVEALYPGARQVLLRCGARTGERLAATTPSGLDLRLPRDVRSDHLHEFVAGRRWRISARSFFQTRADGAEALAELVGSAADELGAPTTSVDLYSGVGLFAGVLAARGWSVTAVEGSRSAAADAAFNLSDSDASVVHADITRWKPTRGDLVVADPSRIGLGRTGVEAIKATGARRVVLISCDGPSLGRDAALLMRAGYGLSAVTYVDLFPQTFRIEAVTVYDR
ncbi:MAG TPA: TRAM domain-containing protein [Acidimicrobiales bacterium]|nr:TRAM domain-containing protein [Acidimicrobiales bacterium]